MIGLLLAMISPADDLQTQLEKLRSDNHLPSFASAIYDDKKVLWEGVAGVRRYGAPELATTHDIWHMGSCTKAMTAYITARLVDKGLLKWSDTPRSILGSKLNSMSTVADATLTQLMAHRSGMVSGTDVWPFDRKDGTTDRLGAVKYFMTLKPQSKPGEKNVYSNANFMIVGAMIEAVTHKTWEQNISELLFKPLQMTSAGFGNAAHFTPNDQPWPHTQNDKPIPKDDFGDNARTLGPAGTVHVTLADWSKFAQEIMRCANGESKLLSAKTQRLLTTPHEGWDYNMGWITVSRPWAKGLCFTHAGSNTMNYCDIWIAPKTRRIYLTATNVGTGKEAKPCDDMIGAMIGSGL